MIFRQSIVLGVLLIVFQTSANLAAQTKSMKGGLWSPREDVGSLEQKFKKLYLDSKYSTDEAEKKLLEWENLMPQNPLQESTVSS